MAGLSYLINSKWIVGVIFQTKLYKEFYLSDINQLFFLM